MRKSARSVTGSAPSTLDRRGIRLRWAAVCILFMAAACGEAPTTPLARAIPAYGGPQSMLQPIEVHAQYCPYGWYVEDDRCRPDYSSGGGSPTFDGVADGVVWGVGGSENWPPVWGMEGEEWSRLSPAEKELVMFDEPPKWINRRSQMVEIADFANKESLRLSNTKQDVDGSKQNGILHALWAGTMAMAFGYSDARKWSDAHEERPVPLGMNPELFSAHKRMDLHNNEIGLKYFWRPIGTLSDYVMERQNQLICVQQDGTGGYGTGRCP